MRGRFLSLQLPAWPIERHYLWIRRQARQNGLQSQAEDRTQPLALLVHEKSADRLYALNAPAAALGLRCGMVLADARAAVPDLTLFPADVAGDVKALEVLAHWCGRFSPWVMVDDGGGKDRIVAADQACVLIDISGCAHLFGGESSMMAMIEADLARFGFSARIAIADRALPAWAWCRYGAGGVLPATDGPERLRSLPVAALRIDADLVAKLKRLGLNHVGDLIAMPRASLLRRFDVALSVRLDQMFGDAHEPFTPLREPERYQARISWPEPIGRTEDIEAAIRCLADDVCSGLEKAGLGARRLCLRLFRIDGERLDVTVGTSAPSYDAAHLARLFKEELDRLDAGFGIELMLLDVLEKAPFERVQECLVQDRNADALHLLIDQLQNRLGKPAVTKLLPYQSHWPERAQRQHVVGSDDDGVGDGQRDQAEQAWLADLPRPLRFFHVPRPVDAVAAVPDGPPILIGRGRKKQKIVCASGPERVLPEWWRDSTSKGLTQRDYYDLVTEAGERLWVFRDGVYGDGATQRWWLQGLFH